ncbi:LOW QUALITY PROTEIN: ATPase family AAA domain-containing protein 5-like [Patiria miniata]|uniref:ATPase AAA-type core domain-containing protein n=1 Tax=Patiria miniata TaxID=46514 RepID=A0A914AKI6_PATMI|nr:LOW QUALITY PROTEIN: ATPase family AAA domain-containing protein 5-like [Patiria miniata]
MIGIMSTKAPKAASGQNMDDDNPNIKSPSSATVKKSMITSFFKPKTLKQSPETSQNNLNQGNTDRSPIASGVKVSSSHTEDSFKVKAASKGQGSDVISKGQKHDGLDGPLDPEKGVANQTSCLDAAQRKCKPDKVKDSTSQFTHVKSNPRKAARIESVGCLPKESRNTGIKVPPRCSPAPGNGDKSSQKRKKKVELNSSSDDFEVDKRTKTQKREVLELKEEKNLLDGEVPEDKIPDGGLLDNDAASSCSDADIFEVKEPTGNPKVISYLDFLNESMGENQVDRDEINYRSDNEIKEINDKGMMEDHHVVEKPQTEAKVLTREKHIRKKITKTKSKKDPKTSVKPSKFSTSTKSEETCIKIGSDVGQEKECAQKERGAEPNSATCLPDDDSVLTISYSEFTDDKTGSKSRESSSLSLMYPKQKLVTIEAEVHSPPCDEAMHPGNSPVTIDLCHSPEHVQTPASKKRTSNVVVSVSDLDLMIVSTDDASASADSRKSKTVYSIFQKKGTMEQTESKALKKPEPTETSKDAKEISDVKPKQGRSRKRHKCADFSPENKSRTSTNTNDTLRKARPKTQNGRQAKKTLKSIFDGMSEEENTEEEFQEEISKRNEEGTNRRRGRPKKSRRRSDEDGQETGGSDAKKTSQRAEIVVLTSTPKAKTNKNTKARQLLRRAKSQQMNKASAIPSQAEHKLNTLGTKCATHVAQKQTRPESGNQTRKQRDLTNVLGRRCAPKEGVVKGKQEGKTTKKGAEKKKAVIAEAQERKPTKLAPMFTKEGRQALGKKQQTLDRQISSPSVMIIPDDDDETSRDSVRSDVGGAAGGAKLFSDALVRSRDAEAERSYPPFPTISHVLQMAPEIDGNRDWWNLPAPGSLGKFLIADRNCTLKMINKKSKMVGHHMRLGEFTRCSAVGEKTPFFKSFSGHPELSHDTQRLILDQIKAANPRFPVNRVFKRYLAKRKGEPLIPKPLQGEGTSEAKGSPKPDTNFTKLKTAKPSAKRKSEVLEQQATSKRRKVAPEESAEKSETEFIGKIRLRRRSSRWVIRDDDEEETKDCKEQPKPRRSSRQSEQAVKKEGGATELKERRTLRTRRGKTPGKVEAEKEGCKEAVEAKTVESKADKLASLPWTEKYQPITGAEIIGNGQAMKRLTGWLTEWKKKTARIKKKMKRQQGKQRSKTLPALPMEDSDSDFDLGSDSDNSDSDDDDDSLSNAMLIVGPCGCGKTAAVYACAKELGFKVFEVNASSKRTGKQILADLGEATQSHHLTAHHHGNSSGALKSFFPLKSPPKSVGKPETKKTPIPKAFAAFYKAGADAAAVKLGGKKTKAPTKKSPKKSQVKQSKSAAQTPKEAQPLQAAAVISGGCQEGAPGQRLTSTSLILFEDVDVVFEEDKGFLSAIATFLKTTKRPIILTTSDGRFPEMFEERYEMVTFRKPPSSQLATHLQLLCLAENVNASHADLHHLVSLLDRDVRRCWLAAQLWVNSGADQRSKAEDSDSGKAQTVDKSSKVLGEEDTETNKGDGYDNAVTRMHGNCFESTMGLCNLSGGGSGVSSMLKIHRSDGSYLHTSSAITERFQKENNASVFFRNIHTLLPPFSSMDSFCAKQENSTDQSQMDSKPPASNGRTATLLTHKLVSSLATFADDISFLDSHTLFPRHDGKGLSENGWWGAELKSSLLLDPAESDGPSCVMLDTGSSIRGFLEAASFNRCHRNYEKAVNQFKHLHRLPRDNCHNNMQEETPQMITKPAEIQSRCDQDRESVLKLDQDDCTKCPDIYSTIVNKLPLSVHCNHQVLSMEYLPTLRCMCRSEQIREELKIKRRFLHYLDSISLNLKKTDQITMCSIMEAKQPANQDDKPKENVDGL